jgi:UDP-N-acetylmuramyl pentapeptide phosphotransferase/UDP-N-acetylglucosamine-1-phosphate transferase
MPLGTRAVNITFDPYAFGFAIVMHLFIVPCLRKHAAKPRPELPSTVKTAAYLLLTMGGVFTLVGVALGTLLADLPRVWRFVWIAVASIGGALWIWNAFRLRDGIRSARWMSIPFLVAAFPCLPVLGWIASPFTVYCLFIDGRSRQFFRDETIV